MNLNGTEYYYIRNAQGDITGLFDNTGITVVEYTYDSWGKLISTTGSLASTVGAKNPYRYRGYRYDTETGLYYLQSRYYNPEFCRILNADAFGGIIGELLSHNVFAYSLNNPVNRHDPSGYWSLNILKEKAKELILRGSIFVYVQMKFAQSVINNKIKNAVSKVFGKFGGKIAQSASKALDWSKGIKATQELNKGTNIPRSFVMEGMKIEGKEIWVHGNATKHMAEFVNAAVKRTGHSALAEREIMLSFKQAVQQAIPQVRPGVNKIFVNGWELGINGDTAEIFHALMK